MPSPPQPSPRRFLLYSSGNCGIGILRQIIVFMPLFFYSPPPGQGREFLLAAWVGYALFIGRLVDVVSDPVVGYLSDRTRHRWGKRLPYIVFGTPLWVLFTLLIFTPPAAQHGMTNFLYLAATASLFFISMTVVQIPYMAVLPEITRTEDETVRVAVRMGRFYILGILLILVGGWTLSGRLGFPGTALLFSLVAAVFIAASAGELFGLEQRPVEHYPHRFWRSAAAIVRQRPFWAYLVGHSLFICGYYIMLVVCPYFVTEIVRLPKEFSGIFLLLPMVVAMAATPAVGRACLRHGKKPVMLTAMLLFAGLFTSWFFIGRGAAVQESPTLGTVLGITAPWAQQAHVGTVIEAILLFALVGLSASVQMLVPPAIVADLVAYDERRTGRRREALVFGLQGGIEKNAVMIATLVVSLSLGLGKEAANPKGIYLVGPIASLMSLAGCLVFLLYPLKKGWREESEDEGQTPEDG